MRLMTCTFLFAVFVVIANAANPPLACLSSAPSLTNVFSTNACSFVPAKLSDFFYGNANTITTFLNRPGVHCKPSLIAKDIAIAKGAYAAIRYLESVRYPLPAPTGTVYSPAVCSAYEGPLVTGACGKTSKRDYQNAYNITFPTAGRQPTQSHSTIQVRCNNPNVPQSCTNWDQASPLQHNATLWYEGNFDPSNPYAYSYGTRLPEWFDLFFLNGESTYFFTAWVGDGSSGNLQCDPAPGYSATDYAGSLTRLAASMLYYQSCTLEGGNGVNCQCSSIINWWQNICPFTNQISLDLINIMIVADFYKVKIKERYEKVHNNGTFHECI